MDIIGSIDLFPFYRAFFGESGKDGVRIYSKLTDSAKMKHKFMLYRLISIEYPQYMQEINKIDSVHVIDAMHEAFKAHNGKQPWWTYAKAKWEKNNASYDFSKYSEYLISEFCKLEDIDRKNFRFLLISIPSEMKSRLDAFSEIINQKPKRKKK